MSLETVPKDLRNLRACLLCSLVKVSMVVLIFCGEIPFLFMDAWAINGLYRLKSMAAVRMRKFVTAQVLSKTTILLLSKCH